MKFSLIRFFVCILIIFPIAIDYSLSAPLTDEVVEKLRQEGKLDQWINQWQSAAQRGMYEKSTYQQLRLMKVSPNTVDTLRPLVLCVDFSDNVHTYNSVKFDTLLFSKNYVVPTGSFRDYYRENSYGKHDPDGGEYGWVRAPQLYTYYTNGTQGLDGYPHNAQKLVEDALYAADDSVDFSDYDYNHDGWIDGLIVVHAGPGAEETGSDWQIWSHDWSLPSLIILDGVKIKDYTMQPEKHKDGSFITIGVFCHEWGHFLGINWEEYDPDYSSEGLGDWSVMAKGCYNNNGRTPAHHSAFCKYYLGWSNTVVVGSNQTNAAILQAETSPISYRLWTSGGVGNQYFMVENRQKTGFDSSLPGSGLLIYYVDASVDAGNRYEWCPGDPATPHYKTALMQADGLYQLEGCNGTPNDGDGNDPFPGNLNKRAFDDTTSPNSHNYNTGSTQVAVWNVSDSDSIMYANLDVTWSRPCVFLDTFKLDDTAGGNGNGRAEAGETVKMYFSLKNIWLSLTGTAVTSSADNAGITFTDSISSLGTIGSGATVGNYSDPMEFTVAPDIGGKPVVFNLRVQGNGGAYSSDFNRTVWVGKAEILVVDDDSGSAADYQSYYTSALDSIREIYDIWDTQAKANPTFSFNQYKYLIWYTGDHKTSLFTQAQVESLMSFLDHGGGLFLTSQDAAEVLSASSNPWDTLFLKSYLHCGYGGYSPRQLVAGIPGDEVGDTLWIYPGNTPGASNQTSKDILNPNYPADTVLAYADNDFEPTDSVAGLKYEGIYKLVFFGFGFEGINGSGDYFHGHYLSKPVLVMERVLNWLKGVSDVPESEEETVSLPKAFELEQNYPNPFNPTTTIHFTVHSPPSAVRSPSHTTQDRAVDGSQFMVHSPIHTTLKIYNILGEMVKTLVDDFKYDGSYTVVWDGRDEKGDEVSSGIYFYRLKVGDYSEAKKMVLLK
jgi:immune inhibitor A